jgi:hypothetical protein
VIKETLNKIKYVLIVNSIIYVCIYLPIITLQTATPKIKTILVIVRRDGGKPREAPVKTADLWPDISNNNLPKRKQKCQPLDGEVQSEFPKITLQYCRRYEIALNQIDNR